MKVSNYNVEPLLRAFSINVDDQLVRLDGRVLDLPMLIFGKCEEAPRNGHWNFNNKTMVRATKVGDWVIACFNLRIPSNKKMNMGHELQQCCSRRGLVMANCSGVLEESPQDRKRNPVDREERMLNQMLRLENFWRVLIECLVLERCVKFEDCVPWAEESLRTLF